MAISNYKYYFFSILNTKYDGVTIPLTQKLTTKLLEFNYGEEGKAVMSVMCTKPPYNLSNHNCYTFMHTFVNGKK